MDLVAYDPFKIIQKSKTTDIKTGDLFRLGQHFLLCGDSTKSEDVQKLVGKNKIDVVLIDTAGRIHTAINLLQEMAK